MSAKAGASWAPPRITDCPVRYTSRKLMKSFGGLCLALTLLGTVTAIAAPLETSSASPAPGPTPVPAGIAPLRLADPPVLTISRLAAENPFGLVVEAPALIPTKPVFTELVVTAPFFATMRVDRTGKVTQSKRVRDPIPSLSADSKKSLERWTFEPARKSGQPVETWASVRLDLQAEIRPPKIEQITLTPVMPTSAIPVPFEWATDTSWYENLKVTPPSDGTVPLEQVDTPPNPKKTRWDADSYKGPFSCRFWVKVNSSGRIEKVIPIQVSDPILITSMRKTFSSWALRPARVKGQPADSWNDLVMSGQIGYSIEVKQIANLRKTLAGS